MINIARLALLAAFSLSAASIACSAPPPAPSPSSGSASTGSQDQKTARNEDGTSPPASGDKASAPSSDPDGGAPPAKGGGDGEKEVPPADPQCVASCNSGLKAKCQGDDMFCDDICSFYTPQEIACLTAASSCEKSVWVQCEQQNGGGGK